VHTWRTIQPLRGVIFFLYISANEPTSVCLMNKRLDHSLHPLNAELQLVAEPQLEPLNSSSRVRGLLLISSTCIGIAYPRFLAVFDPGTTSSFALFTTTSCKYGQYSRDFFSGLSLHSSDCSVIYRATLHLAIPSSFFQPSFFSTLSAGSSPSNGSFIMFLWMCPYIVRPRLHTLLQ